MIGQLAELPDGRKVTIVGYLGWGFENNPNNIKIRYIWTTSGDLNGDNKRIDKIRSADNVKLCK